MKFTFERDIPGLMKMKIPKDGRMFPDEEDNKSVGQEFKVPVTFCPELKKVKQICPMPIYPKSCEALEWIVDMCHH